MKTKRPGTPSIGVRINALLHRFEIICHICGERILAEVDIAWDHVHEWKDSKQFEWVNHYTNYAPVHLGCHKRKSAEAEALRHHIDRLERERNGEPKRARDKYKKPIPQRKNPWPAKSQPMKSRNTFQNRKNAKGGRKTCLQELPAE